MNLKCVFITLKFTFDKRCVLSKTDSLPKTSTRTPKLQAGNTFIMKDKDLIQQLPKRERLRYIRRRLKHNTILEYIQALTPFAIKFVLPLLLALLVGILFLNGKAVPGTGTGLLTFLLRKSVDWPKE